MFLGRYGNMERGDKVGIVCCSNGIVQEREETAAKLVAALEEIGLSPVLSRYLYAKDGVFAGSGMQRAQALMDFYEDDGIQAIFDISGGDIANEVIPYLDFEVIAGCRKQLWGYSDLTTLLNAVYARTGNMGVLYQVRNLVYSCGRMQREAFARTVLGGEHALFDFPYQFIQGDHMEGIVLGGNIRCLLKLAGTGFWPDFEGKLLLLEAYGDGIPQMVAFLSQLKLMGIFEKINGILLGTFTKMEREGKATELISLVQSYAGGLPVIKTQRIGHGEDSCGIVVGGYRAFAAEDERSSYAEQKGDWVFR